MLSNMVQHAARWAPARTTGQKAVLAAPRQEGRPLSLLICPLRPEASPIGAAHPMAHPMALIFVGDSDDRSPAPAETLAKLYGLTPAEARLVEGLLAGETLQDYADRPAVSLHTAKTHLKHVFAKTGTGRQANLIRDLLTNPVLQMAAQKS